MTPPKVFTVLLNWNGYGVSRKCIESLRAVTYPNHEVVLVDNASPDGSGPRLRDEYPHLTYVQNDRNVGFARGCNTGTRVALQRGADYVLLLNNDCTVTPGFLEPLVELAESDPKIGLVSGKIYITSMPGQFWYAGARISRLRGAVVIRGFKEHDRGQYDQTEEVGGCTGAMMFIRRRVLEEVGLLPPQYFLSTEEWDYSLTVRRAGYKLFYCPKSLVHHEGDGSKYNRGAKYIYVSKRSKFIFQQKYLPPLVFPIWSRIYALYAKYLARFRLDLPPYELEAFRASVAAALRDHRRVPTGTIVEEEDLTAFDEEFVAKHGPPPPRTANRQDLER